MPNQTHDPNYLLRWDFARDQFVDRDVVQTTHRLADLPLASDQGLQELLLRIPPIAFCLHTMGHDPAHPSQWQAGLLGNVGIPQMIDLIHRGRIWLTVPKIDLYNTELGELVSRLSQELRECHVGLRIIQPHAELVVSSPSAHFYYGCDPMPSVLWHLRGRMRLRIYPNDQRFVDRSAHRQITDQQTHQRLYFEPSFDRHARVINVEPGQMISWPQPMPYRIENVEGLNVSLRLVFHTSRSTRQSNVHAVNRFLFALSLDRFCDDRIDGLAASLKHALATLIRRSDQGSGQKQPAPTFQLDTDSPSGVRSLTESYESGDSVPTSPVTSLNLGSLPTATTPVLEN